MRRLAKEVDADVLVGGLYSIEPSGLALGVHLMDQVIDLALVQFEPWVHVGLIDVNRTLLAWHDKVEVHAETEPRIEGHPVQNEVELRLNHEEE